MRRVKRYDVDTDDRGRLVTAKAPPPATPHVPVRPDHPEPLTGQRVIVVEALAWLVDMRAVSEPKVNAGGVDVIDVVDEADWYMFRGAPDGYPQGRVHEVPVVEVFLD